MMLKCKDVLLLKLDKKCIRYPNAQIYTRYRHFTPLQVKFYTIKVKVPKILFRFEYFYIVIKEVHSIDTLE